MEELRYNIIFWDTNRTMSYHVVDAGDVSGRGDGENHVVVNLYVQCGRGHTQVVSTLGVVAVGGQLSRLVSHHISPILSLDKNERHAYDCIVIGLYFCQTGISLSSLLKNVRTKNVSKENP